MYKSASLSEISQYLSEIIRPETAYVDSMTNDMTQTTHLQCILLLGGDTCVLYESIRLDCGKAPHLQFSDGKHFLSFRMCGRTVFSMPHSRLLRVSNISKRNQTTRSYQTVNYNVSPSSMLPTLLQDSITGDRVLISMKWGLEPRFTPSHHLSTINARVENITSSKVFGPLIESQRCVVIVDAFYEWSHENKDRIPYLIRFDGKTPEQAIPLPHRPPPGAPSNSEEGLTEPLDLDTDECVLPKGVSPLFLAGLYDISPSSGNYSFTILTMESCGPTARIHDRMPVLLSPETAQQWLDCGTGGRTFTDIIPNVKTTSQTLSSNLVCIQVSSLVNSVANKSRDVTLPVEEMKKRSFEKGLGRFLSIKKQKLQ
jgi:putative SOS response-associated peptidase YedK